MWDRRELRAPKRRRMQKKTYRASFVRGQRPTLCRGGPAFGVSAIFDHLYNFLLYMKDKPMIKFIFLFIFQQKKSISRRFEAQVPLSKIYGWIFCNSSVIFIHMFSLTFVNFYLFNRFDKKSKSPWKNKHSLIPLKDFLSENQRSLIPFAKIRTAKHYTLTKKTKQAGLPRTKLSAAEIL